MRICQVKLNDRLGCPFEPLEDALAASAHYLLIVHPPDVRKSVSLNLPEWLEDPNCRGVLYISGIPRAGLSREDATTIERENNQRVHFLSYSVGEDRNDLKGDLRIRFARFFTEVEIEDRIDWELIDEPWPENLFAIYLLATALFILSPEEVQVLMAQKERWVRVWQAARREYRLSTTRELTYEGLNAGNASQMAREAKNCMTKLGFGADSEVSRICKALRHDWLVNDILFFSADSVSKIHAGLLAGRDSFDQRVKEWGGADGSLTKAKALSAQIVDGFNPVQRIDECPIVALQEDARALIRKAFSDNCPDQAKIRELSQAVQVAVAELADGYSRFLADWDTEPPVEQTRIQESFEAIRRAARVLHELLGELPRGVLLP